LQKLIDLHGYGVQSFWLLSLLAFPCTGGHGAWGKTERRGRRSDLMAYPRRRLTMVAGFGTGRGGGGSVHDVGAGHHEDDAGGVGATCCSGRGAAGSDAGERRRPGRAAPGWCVGRGGVQT